MQFKLIAQSGSQCNLRLNSADFLLPDLTNFKDFRVLMQMCFMDGGSPWLPASWWSIEFSYLNTQLGVEADVLPYHYGLDGDFGGGESVRIDGETWHVDVGPGRCELSRLAACQQRHSDGFAVNRSRDTGWIDLRGLKEYSVDERVLKLQRRKTRFRWYDVIPEIAGFLDGLEPEVLVRAESQL